MLAYSITKDKIEDFKDALNCNRKSKEQIEILLRESSVIDWDDDKQNLNY